MNIDEVSNYFNISKSSLLKNFPRSQKAILKKYGVKLLKEGRGSSAYYSIEDVIISEAPIKEKEIQYNFLFKNGESWELLILLALANCPMGIYRGNIITFLKILNIDNSEVAKNVLKYNFIQMQKKGMLLYLEDYSNQNYFIVSLSRKFEITLGVNLEKIILTCKKIVEKNNKSDWLPLLKVWLSLSLLEKDKIFTLKQIQEITGLSLYQIKESKNLLENNFIFNASLISKQLKLYLR